MTYNADEHAQYLERLADRQRHPEWCSPERHDDEEWDYQPDHVEHVRSIASGFLPEVRRRTPDGPPSDNVTREALGAWSVNLERHDPISGRSADQVVTVEIECKPTGLRLLPGEALMLAAALTKAAHKLL